MSAQTDATQDSAAEYISFDEFSRGLPQGRFRVVVNPALAKPFVAHFTRVTPVAIAMIGPGIAVALAGYPWIGALLVAAGVVLRRTVRSQAPRILLHMASRVRSVYDQATEHGVMEVRRA
ncbi:hypothetical protein [Variovorax sp. OV329]|uniref:hypothetical protein n=1 Tax=Variovorax sp. OV329 TaxID=1882825 RepID=UPI0008F31AEC|nr:hypothetical protein [Variovorax sp. OV329]SFL94698.1 hypothetical protein SAMN05444747_101399 [Variovorax sp. OV329]